MVSCKLSACKILADAAFLFKARMFCAVTTLSECRPYFFLGRVTQKCWVLSLRSEDEKMPRGPVSCKTAMKVSKKPAKNMKAKGSSMKVCKTAMKASKKPAKNMKAKGSSMKVLKPAVQKVRKVAVQKKPSSKARLPSEPS